MSDEILKLVALAKSHGLAADESEWSKAFVYWFDGLMPSDVRDAGNSSATLDYISSEGTPHNPPDEGFIDRASNTAISFLLKVE